MCAFTRKYDDIYRSVVYNWAAAVEEPGPQGPGFLSSQVGSRLNLVGLRPSRPRFRHPCSKGLWRTVTRREFRNAKWHPRRRIARLAIYSSSLNVVWQEWCPISGQGFPSLEGFTHNPVQSVDTPQFHVNIKKIGDDGLIWQMTSSDEQWQHSQMHLLEFMWLVSSEFVEIRSVISPYQTTFMYVVNAPKKYFCFCTCCVCLYQACAAVFGMHTTGTNDVVSQVWTLTPLALLPSMWRIVGKNRKKKLLVGQAKCEYWI